ncbi:MAG: tRNA (guanosine(46)-N7)-methyltransferase TrmB [Propionibacteriaceae bacterium]|nr:tRNA (guanosine(46)-N7)-methyltransferase TrmB [Propionibacteriaceae bacterium]
MSEAPDHSSRTGVPRDVVSFVRRSARLSTAQRRAWEAHASRWVLDVPRGQTDTSIDPSFSIDLTEQFGRAAPLIVEIGSGMGGSLVSMAKQLPQVNLLAFEVYQPAVARTLASLARHEVTNVRLVQANAVEGLTTMLPKCSVDGLWVFFPDPWHKSRHHKRRLLTPGFADLAASRLRRGATVRLATDWADYAGQMRRVLDDHRDFINEHPGSWAPRWADRPVTKFEERGLEAGRRIFELTYRRR